MKNADIRRIINLHGLEWVEIANSLGIPLKVFVKGMNDKQLTQEHRTKILQVIERLSQRAEIQD